MKKILFFCAMLVLLLPGCADSDSPKLAEGVPDGVADGEVFVYGSKRSSEEAASLAEYYANSLLGNDSRAGNRRAESNALHVIGNDATSRSGEPDTLIYVVNFEDNAGFALISAGREHEDLLALVPEGQYDPAEESDNEGFNYFMEAAEVYAASNIPDTIMTIKPVPDDPEFGLLYKVNRNITRYEVPILLGEMAWGQSGIYGTYAPNKIAGCVPTAIGMIVTFKQPSQRINFTFTERQRDYLDLPWFDLLCHKKIAPTSEYPFYEHVCYAPDKSASHDAIAHLLRQIGVKADAKYKNGSTSVEAKNLIPTLKFFLPDCTIGKITEYGGVEITKILDKSGLLLMIADCYNADNERSGHAWVADSYIYTIIGTTIYEKDEYGIWRYSQGYVTRNLLTHFNWGHDGSKDGYFSGTVFDFLKNPTFPYKVQSPRYISIL